MRIKTDNLLLISGALIVVAVIQCRGNYRLPSFNKILVHVRHVLLVKILDGLIIWIKKKTRPNQSASHRYPLSVT